MNNDLKSLIESHYINCVGVIKGDDDYPDDCFDESEPVIVQSFANGITRVLCKYLCGGNGTCMGPKSVEKQMKCPYSISEPMFEQNW